ncbi:MAG: hypothetical protein IKC08_05285 [Lentisphaeria bacterium]|nr:hypothetical protein [Lentisphaeria bacterium]
MKFIFSILMLPVFLVGPVIAGMTYFVYYHVSNGSVVPASSETVGHIYSGFLHLCIACGLFGGGLAAIYCTALCIMGFIIKSWYRAALAGGIASGMGYCVWYLNSVAL